MDNSGSTVQNKKDYLDYFLLRNKAYRYTIPLTALACLLILGVLEWVFPSSEELRGAFRDAGFMIPNTVWLLWAIKLGLEIITVMMVTAVSGWAVCAPALWVLFHVLMFADSPESFPFVLLILSLVTDRLIVHGFFRGAARTFLSFVICLLTFCAGEKFILWIINEPDSYLLNLMLFCIPVALGCIAVSLYGRFVPEKVSSLFFISSYSSPKMRSLFETLRRLKIRRRIGHAITVLLILMVVYLMMCAHGWGGAVFLGDSAEFLSDLDRAQKMSSFLVFMLIEAVPVVLIGVICANYMISNPLMLMSIALQNDYCKLAGAMQELDSGEWLLGRGISCLNLTGDIANIEMADLKLSQKNEIGMVYRALSDSFKTVRDYIEQLKKDEQMKIDLVSARSASKAKSDFLSSMSHEIRTPINAVIGLDEMILRESDDQTIKSYASDIQSAGRTLLSLINDVLDFSKIEAGKMEIINADYDLSSTVNDLQNMITARAEAKNLSFMVDVDHDVPFRLNGDETRIKQCALNILTNAVKYTREGSVTLSVSAERINAPGHAELVSASVNKDSDIRQNDREIPKLVRNDNDQIRNDNDQIRNDNEQGRNDGDKIRLRFSVKDTGIGIKAEDVEKLVMPFQRIEEKRNRNIEGTGLGMSIVNNLLALMGSRLEVESEYGKGSTFSFEVEQKVNDWEAMGDFSERHKKNATETRYKESFQAPSARILIVDDTPLNLTVAKGLLKKTRIVIDTASGGKEAVDMASKTKYDALYIDHLMPETDGIETLALLRADKSSPNADTPAVALTANAVSGAKEMYLAKGFQGYLSKPVAGKALEASLVELLPDDKVLFPGDKDFVEFKSGWDGVERRKNPVPKSLYGKSDVLFERLFGIDIGEALKNCGEEGVFLDAASDFLDSIEERSQGIEKYAADADWKNYVVQVHALKSSAKLIGAEKLSLLAKELEAAGDAAQGGDEAAVRDIALRTKDLLAEYRSYSKKLRRLLGKGSVSMEEEDTRSFVSEEKLLEAFDALREAVSAFDFTTADFIMEKLAPFRIPTQYEEKFAKVKKAVRSADTQAVLDALE